MRPPIAVIAVVLVACGCAPRRSVETTTAPALLTRADSVRIAARVLRGLFADSALYGDVRRAMAKPDSLLADSTAGRRRYINLRIF